MMDDRSQQIIDGLRRKGASEERIARVTAAVERNLSRRENETDEVRQLRQMWLLVAMSAGRGWVVREQSRDGVMLDRPTVQPPRRVMISVALEDDGEVWLHASMSRRDRSLATYDDLKTLHATFMPGLVAYQLFVPPDEHVDDTEVLHLWACLTKRVTPDFTGGTGSI